MVARKRLAAALVVALAMFVVACGSSDSGSSSKSNHHACVQCSSLHAATEPAVAEVAIAAAPEPSGLVQATHEAARSVHAPAPRSARAPPLA